MFKSARFKLTLTYCLIFFSIFWLFSAGLYAWMDTSFGDSYITQVKSRQTDQSGNFTSSDKPDRAIIAAGEVALAQLKNTLLALNAGMLIIVPGLAWLLTGRTLRPIEKVYEKQKRFVSEASHELRTPLTIMQGELDVALRRPRKPGEYRAVLASSRQEVGRLHDLTEILLQIARSDQAPGRTAGEVIDLTDLLTEVVNLMQPLAGRKKVKLAFEPPGYNLHLKGSSVGLKQLFTNLIDNAIKFTGQKGSVILTAVASGTHIIITITDTGTGMAEDSVRQAFDRFYRADDARQHAGFGLGLAICKAIVDQHGGKIKLESAVGKGTAVHVTLPKNG